MVTIKLKIVIRIPQILNILIPQQISYAWLQMGLQIQTQAIHKGQIIKILLRNRIDQFQEQQAQLQSLFGQLKNLFMTHLHDQTSVLHQEDHHQQVQLDPKNHSQSAHNSIQTLNLIQIIYKKKKTVSLRFLLTISFVILALFIINTLLPRKPYHHRDTAQYQILTDQMINKATVQKIFGRKNSKHGITREQFYQAIRKLEVTNYVKYGGEMRHKGNKIDNGKEQKIQNIILQEMQYFESKYQIKKFNEKQFPFCIIVPSYKNIETGLYWRNLNSIFMQNYTNYHVVYVDDGSKDYTEQNVKKYMLINDIPTQKVKIIVHKSNRKPVYTIYNAIHKHCRLGELALIVQGDDALIGTNVLKLYNAIYHKEKCAMIYSSYLDVINNIQVQLGIGREIMNENFEKNTIRTLGEIPGRYLLSFYVDVFKSIKEKDFQDDKGFFFWFDYDRIFITHLLEISYPRIQIVKEILYEHRRTPESELLVDSSRQSNIMLSRKPYKPLKFFPYIERNKYKYFFDGPVEQIIKNTDFSAFTIENNFEIQGISKNMHIKAIKLTQIIHNIRFGGDIAIQLADYETSKEQKYKRIQELIDQDKRYYNQKYNIDYYRKHELPFCVVTPSYNNVKSGLYLRNLDSIFMQDYHNYRVIYIDDCSPDKTGEFVQKYLQEKKIPQKLIQVIINKENQKAMSNLYMAIHQYCQSGQVVVLIDGDDSFIGRNVLALYNAVYQRDGCAMAYSSFLTIHNNDRTQLGFCHDINKYLFQTQTFRKTWHLPGTHLMSFYSDLFWKIKIEDLKYANGTFFDYAYDRAILTPLLEMAYPRISVIKEITYEYRNDTGINDDPDQWIRVSNLILKIKTYDFLKDFPFIRNFSQLYAIDQTTSQKPQLNDLIPQEIEKNIILSKNPIQSIVNN